MSIRRKQIEQILCKEKGDLWDELSHVAGLNPDELTKGIERLILLTLAHSGVDLRPSQWSKVLPCHDLAEGGGD